MPEVLARLADRLPAVLIDTLREQYNGLAGLDAQIAQIERRIQRSEEQTSELQSLMRISYAVYCLKQKRNSTRLNTHHSCHHRMPISASKNTPFTTTHNTT